MAMLKLTLAITIVGIMVETAILAIKAMAIGVINVAILWNQLNSIKKLAKWYLIPMNQTFNSDIIMFLL